jgi:hypothetical protein
MNVEVREWIRFLSIRYLNVTAQVVTDGSSIYCPDRRLNKCSKNDRKKDPTSIFLDDFDHSVKLGIPAGNHGKVTFSLTINYKGNEKPLHWSKVPQGSVATDPLGLPFQCSPEGDFNFLRKTGHHGVWNADSALSVELEVYHKRENPSDVSLPGVPESVWKEWMKQLSILKIVIIAKLTMTENGPGLVNVTVKDESAVPDQIVAGSTGKSTAVLGPVIIELEPIDVAPPITVPGGVRYHVYFDKDSSELDKVVKGGNEAPKHQGNAFAAWVREEVNSKWDVMQALYWKKVAVRGEGHASATGHGMNPAQLFHYNKELSKKRLDAVVNRLKKTIAEKDPQIVLETKLDPAGAEGAPYGVEDDYWRRVAISIDGDDLKKAIKDIYSREFGGTSVAEFRSRLP